MERAGRVLAKLKLAPHGVTEEQLACGAWAVAVGKTIANRTEAFSLVRSRLVVRVEDAVWQKQLWALRGQILSRLEEVLGRKIVEAVEFRIAIARREPARAVAAHTDSHDEADLIRDPVFRSIYKASRRKANA